MDFRDASKVNVNRRCLYFLIFLLLVLPVVVGVLVWYFIPKCDQSDPSSEKITGDGSTTSSIPTTPGFSETEPWKNLRLPRYIVPLHYDLTLYPDFYEDNGWFYGNVTIEIKINKDTDYVLIHFNYLNITKTELRENSTGNQIGIKRTFAYAENQFWVIETAVTLREGASVKLSLQFDGSLTRAIVGFYKSSYVNSATGQKRNLATSKFEPVDARRAFPCFDEPNIKAAYTITLIHEPDYTPLSNMPPQESQPTKVPWSPTLVSTRFQRSVMMSTYLVCFIVCDFDYVEDTTTTGTKIRVYATPDKINQTRYSLQIGKHSMEEYERLFRLPYPLPKQDMIAIPDFVSGAMEHWGLITYRETNLLYDPSKASSANKQRVAVVVAHEIAHQWFGNIVTMDWWDDLWLNEGFASFMEYLGVDTYERDWDMMAQFGTEDLQPVMVTDAGVESHPIVVPVYKPTEINAVFDSISYSKGAAVIAMLQSIMGKDKFFEGIANYLKEYEWGNAKTDDLWQALGEVPGAPDVKHIMDTWTRQMGLPYVNVTFHPSSSGGTTVTAVQKRYLSDPKAVYDVDESEFKYKWYISLSYITSNGSTGTKIMDMTEVETVDVNVDMTDASQWIKFNVNQTGYYRVTYPDDIWRRFATVLDRSDPSNFPISVADRSAFINDVLNLARAGLLNYGVALEMTSYLDKETNHIPWESAYTGMAYITKMFRSGGSFGLWRQYVLAKVKPALDRLGWEDTGSHLDKLMRRNLIELACGHGDVECLGNATAKFRNWLDNGVEISPNLRARVYKYGMRSSGSVEDWDKMWQKYQTETVPQERVNFLYALAQTRTVWLLHRYLDYAKNESIIRQQDFFSVMSYVNLNPVGNNIIWNWARENYDELIGRFTLYSRSFGRMVPNIIKNFNTEFKLTEVEAFFKQYPEAGAGDRPRKQALETIKSNIYWMKTYEDTIISWLQNKM
ncbi:glutamyl aminopeptidase-like [Haliotis asinina]|uniref:glutamyl aminopeptidase-like n=1 Tax=Haliotis asinina TaxID=109174 RepID=UPI0035318758